jgi:hypothetical protein
MLVACRLAGLSALGAHYAGVKCGATRGSDAGLRAQPLRPSPHHAQQRQASPDDGGAGSGDIPPARGANETFGYADP